MDTERFNKESQEYVTVSKDWKQLTAEAERKAAALLEFSNLLCQHPKSAERLRDCQYPNSALYDSLGNLPTPEDLRDLITRMERTFKRKKELHYSLRQDDLLVEW